MTVIKSKPTPVWLYRITHIDNLEHTITHGIVTANHTNANPHFRSIGDSSLIAYRSHLLAPNPPGGGLHEYIPFYFGPRSPMLFQIATGWEDIKQIPQQDIIYLISTLDQIKAHKLEYFFTDGHARSETTNYYTDDRELDLLDWEVIYSEHWKNSADDLKRRQKKQSELLVRHHIPWSCVEYIAVFNDLAKVLVQQKLSEKNQNCSIRVSPTKLYY